MNYHNILHDNMLNGEGLRTVLFVSGCNHGCPGCHNPETHDPKSGIPFNKNAINEILESLKYPWIRGLTLTGGDPLYPGNVIESLDLCNIVKRRYPEKDIWIYTGYTWEMLEDSLKKWFKDTVDVLVDGRWQKDLFDIKAPYVGSTNQRIIDVQKTLSENRVVIYKLYK